MTFPSLLFDCASLFWKYGGGTREGITPASVCLRFKALEFGIKLLLSLKLFHINCWRNKRTDALITSPQLICGHLHRGKPSISDWFESQYLHPLEQLANALRGASAELHSSAGPSQRSPFIKAVLNLKTGPKRFALDLNAVETAFMTNHLHEVHKQKRKRQISRSQFWGFC